jgi:biopolymer transport protein ExbD
MIERKRPRVAAVIPTSSMADIAFLLIVFFLVTTSMSSDKGLGLTLPVGTAARVSGGGVTRVWIDGMGRITHDEEKVTPEQLGGRIKAMTGANPNLIVSIKTAPGARYETFVDVVDEIRKAGNDKIAIAEPDE